MSITKRQKEILEFIRDFLASKGYSPTLEEIAERFGISSLNAVYKHLKSLEQRGYIRRLSNQARSIHVVDPDSSLFLHPGEMPEKIRRYCRETGQPVPETRGEIVRVILESLALKYRLILERLVELSGKQLDPLHMIGGGCKNRLLNQFSADVTGRVVLAGPVEATAIGNILMQILALGKLNSLSEARQLVRRSFLIEEYKPRNSEVWLEQYEKLKSLLVP